MSGTPGDRFYLDLAREQGADSNCIRRHVGAVIAKDGTVLASASNGTPDDCVPCDQGGCHRCQSEALTGDDYDSCICIHAEQRAIAAAASVGSSTSGATMYVTLRPCISCLNLCLHAGIVELVYDEDIAFRAGVEKAYAQLTKVTKMRLRRGAA